MSNGELNIYAFECLSHFLTFEQNSSSYAGWAVLQGIRPWRVPCGWYTFLPVVTKRLQRRQSKAITSQRRETILLAVNSSTCVMSHRTRTRHRFVASVALWDNKDIPDLHYPEPGSDTACAANGSCAVKPDYNSKFLSTTTTVQFVSSKRHSTETVSTARCNDRWQHQTLHPPTWLL